MSFEPVVPLSGVAGWRFLERTLEAQRAAFDTSPELTRDIAYFEAHIGGAMTAADLVADRRLLKVALGAFGLGEDIDKRAFIRQVLEGGTEDPRALANRLVDRRYREMTDALGYGRAIGPRVLISGFVRDTVAAYRIRSFEEAVGRSDETMRLALNYARELPALVSGMGESAAWFAIMGDPPLRRVLEGALGLPAAFGQQDVDQQRAALAARARAVFGAETPAGLAAPDAIDGAIRRFLVREQAAAGPSAATRGVAALTLLQSAPGAGTAAIRNIVLSNLGLF